MNLPVIIFMIIAVLVLIWFLIWKNQKDRKVLEDQMNQDYPKSTASPEDIETEDPMH
jgi:preprotein translocase subunit YajC